MPMFRVKVCWPRDDNSWRDVEAATSQEAANTVWPSEYLYDESKPSEYHLRIEVTAKNAVAVERFDVHQQCHPLELEPGSVFDGMVGVAYKLTLLQGTD